MSDDARGQTPPAYGTLEPSGLAIQISFDRIHHTVNAECYSATENSAETKRLRNFLFYCLAVDYRFLCSLTVTAANREHFLELSEVLWSAETIHGGTHLEAEDRVILAPYLWKYLHEPCTSLAIPVESAVAIMLRYEKFLNFRGRYKGCIHGLLHDRGAATLAEKMAMDRSILIPRLVTSEQTRREFTDKVNEIARSYFTYIGGLTSETSILPESGRFTEQVTIEYSLTFRGEL